MAIADAYGASFEFGSPQFVKKYNTGEKYISHSRGRGRLGHYTDDTQMALALVELMLSEKEWTKENIAQAFLDSFHRDERTGYAGGFYNFLCDTYTGEDFIKNILPKSNKSGAPMRSAPLGLLPHIEELIEKTTLQASVTHNTSEGINSAVAVALSAHYFTYDLGKKKDLPEFLAYYIPDNWGETWQGEVSVLALDCTKGAISAIMQSDSLTELLIRCVSYTGDTDTVACIAFGIACNCSEIKHNLNPALFAGLENGEYGRDYLNKIDGDLIDKFQLLV